MIKNIVILGGGSAGWLTAGLIAAEHASNTKEGLSVTLIESDTIKPIGVGEGTWPTMRSTLAKIGVSETDFFRCCDASFKQGIKFVGWVNGGADDYYYHPLELPLCSGELDISSSWQAFRSEIAFADAVCVQPYICEKGLAPKQVTTPEFASVVNYAYHFNSTKLSAFLAEHCVNVLGVDRVIDEVVGVERNDIGHISRLQLKSGKVIEADLYIDCSGLKASLIGEALNVPYVSKKRTIFNDSALAVQVPYASDDAPIKSHTVATAQRNGWIWDIGLSTRRGLGYVYSSSHSSDEAAEVELRRFLIDDIGESAAKSLTFRKLAYEPGYRAKFWDGNCVAVGMSAGFVEPLEATALVMIEAAASMISSDLPANREVMPIVASRFNKRFEYYWQTTIEFLKLQYVLTKRTDTDYWKDCVSPGSVPPRLDEFLNLWRYQSPNQNDFTLAQELLPAASWQYILHGMGFVSMPPSLARKSYDTGKFLRCIDEVKSKASFYSKSLPSNRELINQIHRFGLQKI